MGEGQGQLVLAYRLDEGVPLDATASYLHVERWDVSVLLAGRGNTAGPVTIGDARVLVLNLEDGVDIGDLVDRASGTWVEPAPGPDAGRSNGHVLVLDRVWLRHDHRGRGLGPIVAAAVIARLGRGCHLAACYPAPFEDTALQTTDDRTRAVDALSRVWAKVGFRHWRDGVWMLDLSATDVHATLHDLRAASSSGAPEP